MHYYLSTIKYILEINLQSGVEQIESELTQLVCASSKDNARTAVMADFEKHLQKETQNANSLILLECRIADTIIGK